MKPIKQADIRLFEHDEAEKIIGEARRHWIGIGFILLGAGVLTLLLLAAQVVFQSNEDQVANTVGFDIPFNLTGILGILLTGVFILVIIGTMMAIYVYKHNYLVLTDQKLVVVRSYSVVRRKVSQLSIGDIQDISVNQGTLLSRIFKYGTILIETSGEQANLRMSLISHPFDVSKAIVESHENNLKLYGN